MVNLDAQLPESIPDGILRAYGPVNLASAASDTEMANVTALRELFSHLLTGEIHLFSQYLADDVEFTVTGFPLWQTNAKGRAELLASAAKNFATVRDQRPTVRALVAQGDQVVLQLEETGVIKSTGAPYHLHAVQWFHFRHGKIVRIKEIVAEATA